MPVGKNVSASLKAFLSDEKLFAYLNPLIRNRLQRLRLFSSRTLRLSFWSLKYVMVA